MGAAGERDSSNRTSLVQGHKLVKMVDIREHLNQT